MDHDLTPSPLMKGDHKICSLAVLAKLLDSNLNEEELLIIWDFVRSYVVLRLQAIVS